MRYSLAAFASLAVSNAAYISSVTTSRADAATTTGSEWWTTLTPSATLSGATTDFDGSFAISLKAIETSSAVSASLVKRDAVEQFSDGQLQDQTTATLSTRATASVINQIGDGQIQDQTTATTASVVNQIGDGQIQDQTTATTASVVNQIGDGQIQDQTTATTASVVNQIGDGQIQDQTTATTASVVNQIGDGQIQDQTTATTASVINQIGDGQIQQQSATTAAIASQITDGQVQASGTSESSDGSIPETCVTSNSLTITLKGSQLIDAKGRVGAIVANRQFQFDGPPPQAGSIYAAGWSITSDGLLAIGDSTTFYKCLSGDFYNLYDESLGAQCSPVEIHILKAVEC